MNRNNDRNPIKTFQKYVEMQNRKSAERDER